MQHFSYSRCVTAILRLGVPRNTILLLVTAALVACGGGGGGSGGGGSGPAVPTAPVVITDTNASSVAANAYLAGVGVVNSGAVIGASSDIGTAAPPKSTLGRFTARLAKRIIDYQSSPLSVSGVVQVFNCAISGTYSVDTDNNTYVTLTFSNCSDFAGEAINGSISVTNISGTASNFAATVSVNLTFSETGFPDVTIGGSYNFSFADDGNAQSVTISGTSLGLTDGTNAALLSNFIIQYTDEYLAGMVTTSVSFTFASTEIGGSVTVATNIPFATYYAAQYPHVGQMTVTGANNSSVRLTVNGDESYLPADQQVTIDVDADGIGGYETTSTTSWAALAAL